MTQSPPVIIGAGLAGLSAALALAPRAAVVMGRRMVAGTTSSSLAQGGLAAAVGPDDTPALHTLDTLAAGAGLCDPAVVQTIASEGPRAVERLLSWGVPFDCDEKGQLKLGLEAAHGRRRIVHAGGDATGAVIMESLIRRARATPAISFFEDVEVLRLSLDEDGAIDGVVFRRGGEPGEHLMPTRHVVLATGSACALWKDATVPLGSWGAGLALAAQAGAALRDLEMVQFHPTALDVGGDPLPLVSEAVRGEGAVLVNEAGARFVEELSPRDVVARAIAAQMDEEHRVFLDARGIGGFAARFPTITGFCAAAAVDPTRDLIPVRPVAHYHMGGVATDIWGRTGVAGLWACGECACTGLHGANRLASNSLLEATVMGARVAQDIAPRLDRAARPFVMPSFGDEAEGDDDAAIAQIRAVMSRYLGVRRDKEGLLALLNFLSPFIDRSPRALVGSLIARAALARRESRGAHQRKDCPATREDMAVPGFVRLEGWRMVRAELKRRAAGA